MSNCKNCSNVDVFPLVKNCKAGSCPTGPTGPKGPRGRNGGGSSFSNYLYLKGTVETTGDPPPCGDLALVDNTLTPVKFCAAAVNSGNWDFEQGQTSFIVPEDGIYRITFDPTIQYDPQTGGGTGGNFISYEITTTVTIDGSSVSDGFIKSVSPFQTDTLELTEMVHNELIIPLTTGQSIVFNVRITEVLGELNNQAARFESTSATIQRIL